MAGTVTVALDLTELPTGNVKSITTNAPNAGNEYAAVAYTLANGVNTIPVPAWAVGVIIRPDPTNNKTLTLKGVGGDTGIPLSPTKTSGPVMFPAMAPADIVLTAGALFTTQTIVEFI